MTVGKLKNIVETVRAKWQNVLIVVRMFRDLESTLQMVTALTAKGIVELAINPVEMPYTEINVVRIVVTTSKLQLANTKVLLQKHLLIRFAVNLAARQKNEIGIE